MPKAEDDNNTEAPQEEESSLTPIKPAAPLDDQNQDITELPAWAIEHIKELRAESKSRRLKLNDYQEAQRKKDQKLLEEQGEYKKLADELMAEVLELRPMRDKLNARAEADSIRNAERIDKIPEQLRSIIPTEYSPDKLADWLDNNASKLVLPTAPNLDAGAGGGGGSREKPIQLTAQQKAYAKAANMTEEEYAAQLKALS